MKLTQDDYDERATRIDEGRGSDDDRRLVALYESEGFQRTDPDGNTPDGVTHKLVITGDAEVIKGEDVKPKKAATRRRGRGESGDTQ